MGLKEEDEMRVHLRWVNLIAVVAVLAVLGTGPACAYSAEGSFERTLQVTDPVELEVKTGSGNITISTGAAGSVKVRGTIRGRDEENVRYLESNPPIEQEGNSITIGHIEERSRQRRISISYEIVVPAETEVRAATGSGNERISGVRGPVRATTGSGDVSISNISGNVRATTGSGDVTLDSIEGTLEASTGSGNIEGRGVAGDVEVSTGSGNVEVEGLRGSLRASTGSGNVSAAGALGGDWKLSAGSGQLTVSLPASAAFDLEARTHSGRIDTDHPITVQGSLGRGRLRGKVRGGGHLVDLETGSGNIRIQ
ncbi:MAG: DUF4097 domain-containing protein [Terriglobia bacterium]